MRPFRMLVAVLCALLPAGVPVAGRAAPSPQTLVIGVDRADPANQQISANRWFAYTDFFPRTVRVHSGDIIDFQAAAGSSHIVGLASSEKAALSAYPFVFADTGGTDIATGSGTAKVVFGPSEFPITGGSTHGGGTVSYNNAFGPPVCGLVIIGEQPCHFRGGDDVEVIGPTPAVDFQGQPFQLDQFVMIDAPPGRYEMFCSMHPGMRGVLEVVPADQPTSTQRELDQRARAQFERDREEALEVERSFDRVVASGEPGERTFVVHVGAAAARNHVSIDEMLPNQPLSLSRGDQVLYVWSDPHETHTVAFPAVTSALPSAIGFDCGANPPGYVGLPATFGAPPPATCLEPGSTQLEFVGDPGNAPSGSVLHQPGQVVDAGVRVGADFRVRPSSQDWLVRTDATTATGTYTFECSIHDWMQGALQVS